LNQKNLPMMNAQGVTSGFFYVNELVNW